MLGIKKRFLESGVELGLFHGNWENLVCYGEREKERFLAAKKVFWGWDEEEEEEELDGIQWF